MRWETGVPETPQERDGEGVRQEAHVRVLHLVDLAPVRLGCLSCPLAPFLPRSRVRGRSHNVVETVDLVQDEQQHWCEVMEYCPGGDLYAVIKKGDLGTAEINSYFKQILAGVAYLHSMGVAHRDIKPENLLLDAKGHVKITDFGVSDVFRMCWEKTTHLSKGLCGSEPYIAPEQFEQKGELSRLGVALSAVKALRRRVGGYRVLASIDAEFVRRPQSTTPASSTSGPSPSSTTA